MDFREQLDAYLTTALQQLKIPGIGVTIVRDAEVIYVGGYGEANIEHHAPVTADTIFHSASLGKMFTAWCVLSLLQDGRIALDDKLKKYLPEGPEAWSGVTIRHALSMTGGFGNFSDAFSPTCIHGEVIPQNLWQDYSDDQLLALSSLSPLLFEPGTSFHYSNIGYSLVSFVVARLYGKPYYELLKERLFRPIGMKSAREATWFDIVPNRAAGYCSSGGGLMNSHWTAPALLRGGEGGLYFSPRDLGCWLAELDRPERLRQDLVDLMFEPTPMQNGRPTYNGYALGWQNSEIRGHRKIRHGGTWAGFRGEITRFPTRRLSVAVLANMEEAQVGRIASDIAGIVDPELAPHKTIPESDAGLAGADRQLLSEIMANRPPESSFTDDAWRLWSDGWFAQVAGDKDPDLAATPPVLVDDHISGTGRQRSYRIPIGRYDLHWHVKRAADGRVDKMRFHSE